MLKKLFAQFFKRKKAVAPQSLQSVPRSALLPPVDVSKSGAAKP